MKANTPVAADWPKGTRPASGINLAMVQKEGCGVLNNIAASALAGGASLHTLNLSGTNVSNVSAAPYLNGPCAGAAVQQPRRLAQHRCERPLAADARAPAQAASAAGSSYRRRYAQ